MQQSDEDGAGDGVDWAAVRRLYEEAHEVKLREIRDQFGITESQLTMARLKGGWQPRPQIAEPGANQGSGTVYPRSLLRRILRIVDERLKADEAAVARGEPPLLTVRELMLLLEVTLVAKKATQAEMVSKGRALAAPRRDRQTTKAVGGGFATAEEARAADVAFMRSELIRQVAFLRQNAGLEGADREAEGR
jgi:hypothetical protein